LPLGHSYSVPDSLLSASVGLKTNMRTVSVVAVVVVNIFSRRRRVEILVRCGLRGVKGIAKAGKNVGLAVEEVHV